MLGKVLLLVAHRVDRAVDYPPEGEDGQLEQEDDQADGDAHEEVLVGLAVGEAELVGGFGNGVLLVEVVPALVGPARQRLVAQKVLPVAGTGKAGNAGERLQLGVVLEEGDLCGGAQLAVVAGTRAPSLNVEQHVVRVRRRYAQVLVHLAELELLSVELDRGVGVEAVGRRRVVAGVERAQHLVCVSDRRVVVLEGEGREGDVDEGAGFHRGHYHQRLGAAAYLVGAVVLFLAVKGHRRPLEAEPRVVVPVVDGEGGLVLEVEAAVLNEPGRAVPFQDEAQVDARVAEAAVAGAGPGVVEGSFVAVGAVGGVPVDHHDVLDESCVPRRVPSFQSWTTWKA